MGPPSFGTKRLKSLIIRLRDSKSSSEDSSLDGSRRSIQSSNKRSEPASALTRSDKHDGVSKLSPGRQQQQAPDLHSIRHHGVENGYNGDMDNSFRSHQRHSINFQNSNASHRSTAENSAVPPPSTLPSNKAVAYDRVRRRSVDGTDRQRRTSKSPDRRVQPSTPTRGVPRARSFDAVVRRPRAALPAAAAASPRTDYANSPPQRTGTTMVSVNGSMDNQQPTMQQRTMPSPQDSNAKPPPRVRHVPRTNSFDAIQRRGIPLDAQRPTRRRGSFDGIQRRGVPLSAEDSASCSTNTKGEEEPAMRRRGSFDAVQRRGPSMAVGSTSCSPSGEEKSPRRRGSFDAVQRRGPFMAVASTSCSSSGEEKSLRRRGSFDAVQRRGPSMAVGNPPCSLSGEEKPMPRRGSFDAVQRRGASTDGRSDMLSVSEHQPTRRGLSLEVESTLLSTSEHVSTREGGPLGAVQLPMQRSTMNMRKEVRSRTPMGTNCSSSQHSSRNKQGSAPQQTIRRNNSFDAITRLRPSPTTPHHMQDVVNTNYIMPVGQRQSLQRSNSFDAIKRRRPKDKADTPPPVTFITARKSADTDGYASDSSTSTISSNAGSATDSDSSESSDSEPEVQATKQPHPHTSGSGSIRSRLQSLATDMAAGQRPKRQSLQVPQHADTNARPRPVAVPTIQSNSFPLESAQPQLHNAQPQPARGRNSFDGIKRRRPKDAAPPPVAFVAALRSSRSVSSESSDSSTSSISSNAGSATDSSVSSDSEPEGQDSKQLPSYESQDPESSSHMKSLATDMAAGRLPKAPQSLNISPRQPSNPTSAVEVTHKHQVNELSGGQVGGELRRPPRRHKSLDAVKRRNPDTTVNVFPPQSLNVSLRQPSNPTRAVEVTHKHQVNAVTGDQAVHERCRPPRRQKSLDAVKRPCPDLTDCMYPPVAILTPLKSTVAEVGYDSDSTTSTMSSNAGSASASSTSSRSEPEPKYTRNRLSSGVDTYSTSRPLGSLATDMAAARRRENLKAINFPVTEPLRAGQALKILVGQRQGEPTSSDSLKEIQPSYSTGPVAVMSSGQRTGESPATSPAVQLLQHSLHSHDTSPSQPRRLNTAAMIKNEGHSDVVVTLKQIANETRRQQLHDNYAERSVKDVAPIQQKEPTIELSASLHSSSATIARELRVQRLKLNKEQNRNKSPGDSREEPAQESNSVAQAFRSNIHQNADNTEQNSQKESPDSSPDPAPRWMSVIEQLDSCHFLASNPAA